MTVPPGFVAVPDYLQFCRVVFPRFREAYASVPGDGTRIIRWYDDDQTMIAISETTNRVQFVIQELSV